MPCYEYHCDACGHDFEEMQKISDRPRRSCPRCGARKAHRVISRTTFILKGTGWYTTDYARAGAKAGQDEGVDKRGADAGSGAGAKPDEGKKPGADAKARPKSDGKKDAKPTKGSHAHA